MLDDGSLACLYNEILAGDFRALFLLWLRAREMADEGDDSPRLVPVPAGLTPLESQHEALCDFIGLDSNLLKAAQGRSGGLAPKAAANQPDASALDALSTERQKEILVRLLGDNPAAAKAELVRELRALSKAENPRATGELPMISFAEITGAAEQLRAKEVQQAKEHEERQQREYLDDIAGQEASLWTIVERLVATKSTKGYETAVLLRKGLDDLARHRNGEDGFRQRARELAGRYPRLSGFQSRMAMAGFVEAGLKPHEKTLSECWRKEHRGRIDLIAVLQTAKAIQASGR